MITTLRHFVVDTWIGRGIALIVFIAFIGLSGSFMGLSGGAGGLSDGNITQIGHYKILPQDLAQAIQQRVGYLQKNGVPVSELRSPAVQQEVAHESLHDILMIRSAQLAGERNGLILSDDLIRKTVFSMPEFQDENGQFSADKMEKILSQNGVTHQAIVEQVTKTLMSRATIFGLGQNITPPKAEIEQMVRFYTQARVVDLLRLPFAEGKGSAKGSEQQLKRFYDNHLGQFTEPEFRHARIVTLLPESVEASIDVPDDIAQAVYKQREREYNQPETRNTQVLSFTDVKTAQKAAAAWKSGAKWDQLKTTFSDAVPASVPNARLTDIPDETLGQAIFSAHDGHVVGPIKTAMGWGVARINGVIPPHKVSFEQARASIKKEVQKTEVPSVLAQRLKDFQEAVAGSTDLEKIPDNIGAVPMMGSLDKQGKTPTGTVAPLPGDKATQQAILKQIFEQDKEDFPQVISLPNGGAFAVLVDHVQPGRQKSFSEAHIQIILAWQENERKHAQEVNATALYQTAKKSDLRQAVAGKSEEKILQKDERFSRLQSRSDMPELITRAALKQKVGQTAMLQDGDAFWLVQVTGESQPSADDLEAVRQKVEQQLRQGLQNDVIEALGDTYQREAAPRRVNSALFKQVSKHIFERILGRSGQ